MVNVIYSDESFKYLLPIFATKEFLKIKSSEYGWIIDDKYILSYYIDRRSIFSKLVFTSETISINTKENIENEKLFLNSVVEKVKELNVDLISQPLASVVFKNIYNNSKSIKWGSYIVDLTISEEDIMKNIHSKHRNVIRKAIKDGVIVEETRDMEIIYNNIKETMIRQNRAYPSINDLNKIKAFTAFFIAKKDDIVQGCSVLPFNKFGAMYLYGGSIFRPYNGSLNFMHYKAMLILKEKGVTQYDFMGARPNVEVGSKLEGIQRFKSRFGGELKEGYLWKYELNPKKVFFMNLLQKMIFRLKGKVYSGDAIDQESKK
jgi:lipid II:glycine glycyltransferase (peptidoglycan interpeptide bridge formation enzyme)